jgi:hypothetical protein
MRSRDSPCVVSPMRIMEALYHCRLTNPQSAVRSPQSAVRGPQF